MAFGRQVAVERLTADNVRVLIVEDNPADAYLVSEYLRSGDDSADVQIVSRISEATEALAVERADAILLDMSLPDGQGLEVVDRIRAVAGNTPIVILSGLQDEALATQAVKAGAQDYLIKGHVDDIVVRRAVRYAIERERLQLRLALSEERLRAENARLEFLTRIATRLFSTMDAPSLVNVLAAEAAQLANGRARVFVRRDDGVIEPLESLDGSPDEFTRSAFEQKALVKASDRRLALGIGNAGGRNRWLLDITSATQEPFEEGAVAALELLGRYIGIALENMALLHEVQTQRARVIEMNSTKDDLIAVLAHDFRGALTPIMGFSELISQGDLDGKEAKEAAATILESARRLAALAGDTLELSRVEKGELTFDERPLNVVDIVQVVAAELRGQRQVDIENRAEEPLVSCDPRRLLQVFENVIGNAIKYSPNGSPVSVVVREDEDTLCVDVIDRGIGVPAEEIPFLFERFSRASNARLSSIAGTGVGLHLTNELVRRHGGRIDVRSSLNEGSTFTVVLPKFHPGAHGLTRVLVVSQDPDLAPFVEYLLRANGYVVRHDTDPGRAVERMRIEHTDVVLVDCASLPGAVPEVAAAASALEPPARLISVGVPPPGTHWFASVAKPVLSEEILGAVRRAKATAGDPPRSRGVERAAVQ